MKYLLLFQLLLTSSVFAAEPKLPQGIITLKLDNGQTMEYPADQYKVVKRFPKPRKNQEPKKTAQNHPAKKPVQPSACNASTSCRVQVTVLASDPKKNRVRLMGGLGPNGINIQGGPNQYSVSPAEKLVVGVGYNRLLSQHWSIDFQALTNQTYTLGVGFDF